jgi:hypothetical protein
MESKQHWAYDELARQIARRKTEKDPPGPGPADTFVLRDPRLVRELDDTIEKHFWPAITRTVSKAGLRLMPGTEIEDKSSRWTTRQKTFVVHDPARPMRPGERSVLWYYRGTIECFTYGYMLLSDFVLTLPVTFNILKLIELIGNPMFAGHAPDLNAPGGAYYSVSFHHGEGRDGLLGARFAAAGIADRVRLNLEIIAAVDDLERNMSDIIRFGAVKERLIAAYEAW